ncbi:MAG: saccharopine dehydrogenase NADP-binding domain-containing protein [Actinobacteria bacterium]|nr:saccharopine dehydrogenase NADP-binding domain-containing protein [Actinomycetota bacterium]
MRTIVLGACGAVGREVTRNMAANPRFGELVLADLDPARLRSLAAGLGRPAGVAVVDATEGPALRRAFRGATLVMNCTTYRLGLPVLRAAIRERVDYLDLGGLYNTPKQLELDGAARRAGVRAVIGCGATPGLSNVLVRRAADSLDRVGEVHISFASHRDIAPSPGLLDTLLDEFRPGVPRYTWRGGRLHEVAPFDGARRVRFPAPLGVQEVYYVPHSETYTLPRFIGNGLREVAVRGTWRPSDMRTLRALSRIGMTSDRPVRVDGVAVRPLDLLRTVLLAHPPEEPGRPWAFFLDVEVSGERGGRPAVVRQQALHPADWGRDATGRMTALPAVVGATLLAEGAGEPGVRPPESAFDPARFVAGVRALGIEVRRRTAPPGPARR